jgi:peptidoglycan hydrolase-like protein with peptidoglycan-binding domain
METEQKYVVGAVIILILLSLMSLSGCDYWPPALQAEIEQLRGQLNDALDEQAKAYEELAALKAQMPPSGNGRAEAVGGLAATPGLTPSDGRRELPSGELFPGATEPVSSRPTEPPRHHVVKGSPPPLSLERPPRTGPAVLKLQRMLRDHRMPVRLDGVYGAETAAAVRSFQRAHRLTADGIVGPATYAAFRRKSPPVVLARQVWLQRPPVTGDDVRFIQRALRRAGHRLAVDGRYGPETDVAIARFQRRHGLEPDGIVGPQTWRALSRRAAAR